jgi:nitrogen fixation protein
MKVVIPKPIQALSALIPNRDLRVVVERAMAQPYDLGHTNQR